MNKKSQVQHFVAMSLFLAIGIGLPVMSKNIDDFDEAQSFYNKGDMQSAAQLLSKLVLSTKKSDPNCHYYLANTLLRLGKFSEARSEYRLVLLLHPSPALSNYCNQALNNRQSTEFTQLTPDKDSKGYIGIKVAANVIKEVFPGSPADKSGVKNGNTIFTIDGKSTYGWNTKQVAETLMGPVGTTVNICVGNQRQQHSLVLTRAKPGEELTDALFDESTKRIAADNQNKFVKAQKIDDIDKELITIFRRTQDTTEIYAQVLAALHLIPRHIKQELFDGQCKIVITPTLLEAEPKLAYEKPRGYLHDADYRNVPGMYRRSERVLWIGERYSHGTSPPQINKMVLSTTLHELGHAYDHSQNFISQSNDFMQDYDIDLKKLADSDKTTYYYFVQPEAAGPSELFAELFALSISKKGGITERSASLKTIFPQSFEFVKKYLQKN